MTYKYKAIIIGVQDITKKVDSLAQNIEDYTNSSKNSLQIDDSNNDNFFLYPFYWSLFLLLVKKLCIGKNY